MFSKYLPQITHDFVSLSFITFVTLYFAYFIVIKLHVAAYQGRHRSKPLHYKTFRLYSKNLISNAPSKKEKKFYTTTNRITYFFNALLIIAFIAYIFICFS